MNNFHKIIGKTIQDIQEKILDIKKEEINLNKLDSDSELFEMLNSFFTHNYSYNSELFYNNNISESLYHDLIIVLYKLSELSKSKKTGFIKQQLSAFLSDVMIYDKEYAETFKPYFERIFRSNNNIFGKIIVLEYIYKLVKTNFDDNIIKIIDIKTFLNNINTLKQRMEKENLNNLINLYKKDSNEEQMLLSLKSINSDKLIKILNTKIYINNMTDNEISLIKYLIENIIESKDLHELTAISFYDLNEIVKSSNHKKILDIISNPTLYPENEKNEIIKFLIDKEKMKEDGSEYLTLTSNYTAMHEELLEYFVENYKDITEVQIENLKLFSTKILFNDKMLFSLLSLYKLSDNEIYKEIVLNLTVKKFKNMIELNTIKVSLMVLSTEDIIKMLKNLDFLNYVLDEQKRLNKFNLTKKIVDIFVSEFNKLSDIQRKNFSDLINNNQLNGSNNITKEQLLKIIKFPLDNFFQGLMFLPQEVIIENDLVKEYIPYLEMIIIDLIKKNHYDLMRFIYKYVQLGADLNKFKGKTSILVYICLNYDISKDKIIKDILDEYNLNTDLEVDFGTSKVTLLDIAREIQTSKKDSKILSILDKNYNKTIISEIKEEFE